MRKMITLPGIGGSGEAHWQTAWEETDSDFIRFKPSSWDQPDLGDWVQSLERAVGGCAQPPVLVAHSLACLLVAHWASQSTSRIAGALLVSVPDHNGPKFPKAAVSFAAPPRTPLRFPSLVIASTDDPYGTLNHARQHATDWQTGLVIAGAIGHINASSGLGAWPQGRALLNAFCAGLARTDQGHSSRSHFNAHATLGPPRPAKIRSRTLVRWRLKRRRCSRRSGGATGRLAPAPGYCRRSVPA
jgi:uncharacterized protein